ncbi:MAG: UDP-N-acetylmuramate dehydrogenase [Vicingaceae bacterium]
MKIEQNISLKAFNTFGIEAKAKYFLALQNTKEAQGFFSKIAQDYSKILILGGGSNVLLRSDYDGLVLQNQIKGIEQIKEDEDHVWLRVGAGENWHEFVLHCIDKGFAGIENLSLIPGNVGASPMQNIGAYGVEVKSVIEAVHCIKRGDGSLHTFSNQECKLDYRSSIFKTTHRNQYLISSVVFRLNKKPSFNIDYGAIRDQLERNGVKKDELTIRVISDAVIQIRQSKLPDPNELGNSGSFFKNPIVSEEEHRRLKTDFKELPAYPLEKGQFKLAAGWLIEQAGWKGFREKDYGVHDKQALVLVNHGNASGEEIYLLSQRILDSIYDKFGIELEREVNII